MVLCKGDLEFAVFCYAKTVGLIVPSKASEIPTHIKEFESTINADLDLDGWQEKALSSCNLLLDWYKVHFE